MKINTQPARPGSLAWWLLNRYVSACYAACVCVRFPDVTNYTVGHKKEPTCFVCHLVKNQQILMRFSLLAVQMNGIRDSINFIHLT